ncbi:MAG: thioredoxin domain-containing protein [Zetaproteobacteria bacterium]|nr:thioredoxin domain-containing protein [Pseudobdellovibrionaceae bacterium]
MRSSLLFSLRFFACFLGLQILNSGVASGKGQNQLAKEISPYLLQHKNNPIWWYPWGEAAITAAKKANKPIFLSIGYSTCHWCHVMAGDSFENPSVAAIINKYFIAIKVDREERPDVDAIYMSALQKMTGQGGWPMSLFLTPKLTPFWSGTFLESNQLIKLAKVIAAEWEKNPQDIIKYGLKIEQLLNSPHNQTAEVNKEIKASEMTLKDYYEDMKQNFDSKYAGFGNSPKFPPAMDLMALMRIHYRTDHPQPLKMVETTLAAMARSGMYDQIGGGFHRYATDRQWSTPHFEKMLYDNALLSLAYTEAFQLTQNQEYKRIAKETLDYVIRDMSHSNGGFYSAEDADSEHTEGKFYLWQWNELEKFLSRKELVFMQERFGVHPKGNYKVSREVADLEKKAGMKEIHGGNILHLSFNKPLPESSFYNNLKNKLFKIRVKRIRPGLDDKVLTSWNGLMIAAMARGYQVFRNESYLQAAQKAAKFIQTELTVKKGEETLLLRRYRSNKAGIRGNLSDYAFLIYGLTELYQADFNPGWIGWAERLQKQQNKLFLDPVTHLYFDTDGQDSSLLIRPRRLHDNTIPSGNSVTALNLLRLEDLTLSKKYGSKAAQIIQTTLKYHQGQLNRTPFLLQAVDYMLDDNKEIAIVGLSADAHSNSLIQTLQQNGFNPNKVIATRPIGISHDAKQFQHIGLLSYKLAIGAKATAYVCVATICKLPTNEVATAGQLSKKVKRYTLDQ